MATIRAQDEVSDVVGRIQGAIGSLTGIMSNMGGVMGDVGNIIGSAFSGFATGGPAGAALGAGTAALGAVVEGIEACVKEATASEAVWASLGAAVERSGQSWQTLKKGTEDALLSMSRLTVYSDEQLAQALERLMTFGLSYEQAMQALGATVDFAAAKHMDLESAANLVGKAVDGNTSILNRYGVNVNVAKDATDKFTPVLTALNEQFGGAAQVQASTYAGIQERLKNATSELGEKIGGILLPGLASITEAMIPVVDQFGKGADAVQAWLTEVGKMPEVQGAVTAVQDAFSGLWQGMQDFWGFLSDTFTPVLQELWQAFKDIWDALQPIGAAFAEIFNAMGGGKDQIDLLKAAIQLIAFEIRGIATVIKEVAPYIKQFADAFKAAADFITPILTQIHDAIAAFLDGLKAVFQNFYTWLVGASLWQDMWNALLKVTGDALGKLVALFTDQLLQLGGVLEKVWDQLQVYLGDAVEQIQDTLTQGWQTIYDKAVQTWKMIQDQTAQITKAIYEDLDAIWNRISDNLTNIMSQVKDWLKETWDTISTNTTDIMAQISQTVTDILDGIQQSFQGSFQAIRDLFTESLNTINSLWTTAWQGVQQIGQQLMGQIQGNVTGFTTQTQNTMTQASNAIQSTTTGAWNTVTSTIQGALQSAGAAVSNFWNWLVNQSVWPEGLDALIHVTIQKMSVLEQTVNRKIQSLMQQYQQALMQMQAAMNQVQPTSGPEQQAAQLNALAAAARNASIAAMQLQPDAGIAGTAVGADSLQDVAVAAAEAAANVAAANQAVATTAQEVANVVAPSMNQVADTFAKKTNEIREHSHRLRADMVGRSIWPEMLKQLEDLTTASMNKLVNTIQTALQHIIQAAQQAIAQLQQMAPQAAAMAGMAGGGAAAAYSAAVQAQAPGLAEARASLSAGWVPERELNLSEKELATYGQNLAEAIFQATYGRPSSLGPATPQEVLNATLPVSVVVDGVTVSRVVENRIVTTNQAKATRYL